MCFENFFKLYKTIKESISSNVADLFNLKSTQRTLKGNSKYTRGELKGHLNTPRALQAHATDTPRALQWYSGTRALETFGNLKDTWALRHLGTQAHWHWGPRRALGHSGTRAIRHSRHSRHFTQQILIERFAQIRAICR